MADRKTKQQTKDTRTNLSHIERETGPPVITVDYERYAHFLEDSDLTEGQKQEFLQAMWNIIVEFVSLGFGVHPLQQVQDSCGKLDQVSPCPPLRASDEVHLDHSVLNEFVEATDLETDTALEGVE